MKQLELTPRLQAVASLVPRDCKLADIGTDHAYLPVWLLRSGIVSHAVAADLREGPLDRARTTAREYECTQGLAFRLCDGLEGIDPEEADTIVIAGMGGETIAAILENAPWVADGRYTLILQPMSAQPELRRWLCQHGFALEQERLVQEGEKLYNVFLARFGPCQPMTLGEEWAGRQTPALDQPLRADYLARLLDKTERAIRGISQGKSQRDRERLDDLHRVRQALTQLKEEWDAWQR